jgi:hypothetical protein
MKAILLATLIVIALSKNIFIDQPSIFNEVNKLQKSWVAGHNKYFDGKTI